MNKKCYSEKLVSVLYISFVLTHEPTHKTHKGTNLTKFVFLVSFNSNTNAQNLCIKLTNNELILTHIYLYMNKKTHIQIQVHVYKLMCVSTNSCM